jgi:hypothetical protein
VTPVVAVSLGAVYGVAVWAVATPLVLPVVNPTMREAVGEIPIAWCGAHVVFGLVVGVAQQLRHVVDA